MNDDELDRRWRLAIRRDVRERLRTMSEDEFIADTAFRIGVMTSDNAREQFMMAVHDEVFATDDVLMRTVQNEFGVRNMMRVEFGFVRSY